MDREITKKQSYFVKKCSLLSLFFEMKVTCMPIGFAILWLFTVSVLFFSSYVVVYVSTF